MATRREGKSKTSSPSAVVSVMAGAHATLRDVDYAAMAAVTIADALVTGWISRFGVPRHSVHFGDLGPPLPPQGSYSDALMGGRPRHIPMRPLPPDLSNLPAALLAGRRLYVRRGSTLLPLLPLYAGPCAVLEPG